MTTDDPVLFGLDGGQGPAVATAAGLQVELAAHEFRPFSGGEHKCRPLEPVRGRDAYVLSSLQGDAELSANDKLCRLLFFVDALRHAAARSVTTVVPYLCYSRKDRQTKARDPVTTGAVARVFEAVGTDRVVTVDVHNLAAFQNAFRCATEHLEATRLFVDHVANEVLAGDRSPVVVVSPDIGGVKRARRFQQLLASTVDNDVSLAFVDKARSRGVISGSTELHGEVDGAVTLLYDDLIASGTTMRRVAERLPDAGARQVHLLATHALFEPAAHELFTSPAIDSVIVTDSAAVQLPGTAVAEGLVVLPLAPLLAEAIRRIHHGGSISELLQLDR